MSILRNMSNLLFGQTNTTQNETAQMLSARMKSSSKLNLRDSDIKDFDDPFKFKHFYYPQEVGQLGDGHYMKFEIFTNKKSGITEKEGGITFAGAEDTAAGMLIKKGKQTLSDMGGKAVEQTFNFLEIK